MMRVEVVHFVGGSRIQYSYSSHSTQDIMSLEGAVEGRPSTVDEEEEEEAIAQGGSTVVTGIMGERGDTQGMSKNQLKKAAKRVSQVPQSSSSQVDLLPHLGWDD